ncbi:two-component system sensor histidine kinase CreC [Nibricoccus aquaticus]|uniref:histidine kinase n=1 Tax=Nibricoccus aquaticus TaxID=2576891 RepID=A0A290Q6I8_9BACT|nr:two-component system sensor histidine kinase CreC [Nibricoccus aquaticus]ATC64269.1 two-component system sensor histidine kinase CreC [Nibricoccus aquaticus]
MTLRTRIMLVYLLVVGGGVYYLVTRGLEELRPRYLESMEVPLVDAAHLLAHAVGVEAVESDAIDAGRVKAVLEGAFARRFAAKVYSITKTRVDLRVYVTDARGRVVYDSDGGRQVGEDFSQRRDVARTLRGEYGARASYDVPVDEKALVLYVAAPVLSADGATVGVLTVGKPAESVDDLVRAARTRLAVAGAVGGGLLVALGVAFSIWIATPLARLTQYARALRDGKPAKLPRLAGREVGELQVAFDEMRAALDGKAYVERYVQTLTHEIKSPLSAIRGAAEILAENPPEEAREKFVGNIRAETGRIQRIVDQLLQLASLEARKARAEFAEVELVSLVREVVDAAQAGAQTRGVSLEFEAGAGRLPVRGDRGLLAQAVSALIQNALEFTATGGRVRALVKGESDGNAAVCIEDSGTGIPDFALGRVFERFYSLPRPGSGVKSTGLGLSLVREIAHLHEGEAAVGNRAEGGAWAELRLPRRGS